MEYNANDIKTLSAGFLDNKKLEIKGKIYIITNDINNKVYIGQTRENLINRFNRHCRNHNDSKGSIDYDINFYGKEHFKINLIENVPIEQLDEKEIYWINYYNSYKKGYNRTVGGSGGGIYTQKELQNALNIYYQGSSFKEISNNTGISYNTIIKYINSNNLPKRNSTENQIKASIENAKKATLAKQISIKNITLNIIYSSKKEALEDMIKKGYSKAKDWHNIRAPLDKALNKQQKTYLNFEWSYVNE